MVTSRGCHWWLPLASLILAIARTSLLIQFLFWALFLLPTTMWSNHKPIKFWHHRLQIHVFSGFLPYSFLFIIVDMNKTTTCSREKQSGTIMENVSIFIIGGLRTLSSFMSQLLIIGGLGKEKFPPTFCCQQLSLAIILISRSYYLISEFKVITCWLP